MLGARRQCGECAWCSRASCKKRAKMERDKKKESNNIKAFRDTTRTETP
jgi:hypothetical protein